MKTKSFFVACGAALIFLAQPIFGLCGQSGMQDGRTLVLAQASIDGAMTNKPVANESDKKATEPVSTTETVGAAGQGGLVNAPRAGKPAPSGDKGNHYGQEKNASKH